MLKGEEGVTSSQPEHGPCHRVSAWSHHVLNTYRQYTAPKEHLIFNAQSSSNPLDRRPPPKSDFKNCLNKVIADVVGPFSSLVKR